jgi:predicted transposase YdaD
MDINREYKSSVFSFLFGEPNLLRELYCALEDVTLPPDVKIEINTLRNVLFLGPINDISFEIGEKLIILIEHQSTINPNMALRLLLYIAKMYEKMIKDKNLYGSKLIAVPRPEFFVLYNGAAPYPDEQVLRLSDAFEKASELGLPEKAALELEVRVININQGRNEGIARRCKTLAQYSAFIDKVREYEKELGDKEGAMKAAIKYCREHDILKAFLDKHAAEVLTMLLEEYNVEDAMVLMREEGRMEGRTEGRMEGKASAVRSLFKFGMMPEQIAQALEMPLETVKEYQTTQA